MTSPVPNTDKKGVILVVDDEPDILIALEDLFEEEYRVLATTSPRDALAIIEKEPAIAVILSDQRMPEMTGDEFLARAREHSDAEAILLTGYADLKAVIGAVNKGRIMAYMPKPWDPSLLTSMVRSAYERRVLARDFDMERALLRGLMESTTDQISFKNLDGRFLRLNGSKAKSLNVPPASCIGQLEKEFVSAERAAAIADAERATVSGRAPDERMEERVNPDGVTEWYLVNRIPILDESGSVTTVATIERDITERKLMEMRLRQADKMQALGTLAGGIAHDFNNLLMAVLGSLDLASRRAPDDPRLNRLLQNATYAAERGASLTQRLLSFSRQRDLSLRAVNVNEVIDDMNDLLTRTLGGVVRIEKKLSDHLWPAMVDPDQLELAILNLCINARDAMPESGLISLSTRNCTIAENDVADLAAGDYVTIAVADEGAGIPPEILNRVIEPFFTTKEVGKGTGLGLPMVYGLAQQSGGTVTIESTVGAGTVVELYLARTVTENGAAEDDDGAVASSGPAASILLVDDDPEVRAVTSAYLTEMGHRVIEASDAASALDILRTDREIDLLVADFAMPGMTGFDLAVRAQELRGGIGVLLVTGYADPDRMAKDFPLLHKPFGRAELSAKITEVAAALSRAEI